MPDKSYYQKFISESPDNYDSKDGSQTCISYQKDTISFIADKDGNVAAAQSLTHNNIQNALFFVYNNEDEGTYIADETLEIYEKKVSNSIRIYSDDKEAFIKKIGVIPDGDAHVRSQLDSYAVGRYFHSCQVVSFWNKKEQLTQTEKTAILDMLRSINITPEDMEYEVNPPAFDEMGDVMSYEDFMLDSEEEVVDDRDSDIQKAFHTMEPRMKKLVRNQLSPNEEPAESIRKKKEDRAIWNRTVRGEQFERIYDAMTENTLKYYAFDWDDNLLYMPTEIYLKEGNGDKFAVGTSQYAFFKKYLINEEQFKTDGKLIVGLHEDAFLNFRVEGDEAFISDSLVAETGPAWGEFVTAVNNGRIFSIITARGHSPSALQTAVTTMIKEGKGGLNQYLCIDSLRHMHDNSESGNEYDDEQLLERYLGKLCKYYPVTYGKTDGENHCHLYKEEALKLFVEHVESAFSNMKHEFRGRVSNNFIIGFSDDDLDNVNHIVESFHGNSVEVYDTSSGTPQKVESRFKHWKNKE